MSPSILPYGHFDASCLEEDVLRILREAKDGVPILDLDARVFAQGESASEMREVVNVEIGAVITALEEKGVIVKTDNKYCLVPPSKNPEES